MRRLGFFFLLMVLPLVVWAETVNVGKYQFTANAGTIEDRFELKVQLEYEVSIKAESYTRVYGEANPTFEYTSTGDQLNGVPEITCEAFSTLRSSCIGP